MSEVIGMVDLRPANVGPTTPTARAHERFLTGEPAEDEVRDPILRSWQRCQSLGLLPDRFELTYEADFDLESRLIRAATPVLGRLASTLADTNVTVILTDGQGRVIQRRAGDRSLNRHLDAVPLAPGFHYGERVAGTNGIGISLTERRPRSVLGPEHFAERLHPYACFSAPVRDPLSGRIEGAVDLTCWHRDARPTMEAIVREAALAVVRRLLEQSTARERALLRAYLETRNQAQDARLAVDESPGSTAALAGTALSLRDQQTLREKAAELVSLGRRAAVDVPLSQGQVATLVCRTVTTPSGVSGAAVEAILPAALHRPGPAPSTPPRHTSLDTPPMAAGRRAPGTSTGSAALGEAAASTARGTDGAPTAGAPHTVRTVRAADTEQLLLVGEPTVGTMAVRTRRRLQLLCEAGVCIGTTLDVSRTAEELAEVAVPQLADFVTVDLLMSVPRGEEPVGTEGDLRRMAVGGIREDCPLYPPGKIIRYVPSTPQAHCLASGQSILEPDLTLAPGWLAQDPVRGEKLLLDHGIHSLITVQLRASGTVLGLVTFYRAQKPDPFEDDDLSLAEELVSHGAVCIDNARRYTREHATAVALQRSLLPHGLPGHEAVETAYRYLPAQAGVGGDWFDVIPLSGARVALVVGDVVGHGIQAAATMGRLRTAIHNFSALDLSPDELLAQLDDLVCRLDEDAMANGMGPGAADGLGPGITGTTCLYAIYDPVTGCCTLARAGHLPPAVVTPDGSTSFADLPAGPPLGLGGFPFELAELRLPPGSQLVFYTDGLLDDHRLDIDIGLERFRRTLSRADRPVEETCETVLDTMLTTRPNDDVTLLVARTRTLNTGQVVTWDLPRDPAVVCTMRTAVAGQLAVWGLDGYVFTTELILSELLTNAIRYATGPLQVRMLRTNSLICEVSDGSSTSPHLRHAAMMDEGGRGLFLVAQLAQRWGTRYTPDGKVIWAEQSLA